MTVELVPHKFAEKQLHDACTWRLQLHVTRTDWPRSNYGVYIYSLASLTHRSTKKQLYDPAPSYAKKQLHGAVSTPDLPLRRFTLDSTSMTAIWLQLMAALGSRCQFPAASGPSGRRGEGRPVVVRSTCNRVLYTVLLAGSS